jgi:hypothetical protein
MTTRSSRKRVKATGDSDEELYEPNKADKAVVV